MRLIDADALIEIVEDGLRNNPHKDGRERVCHRSEYMHFLDVIHRMPIIAPPPNDPLTMEEMREIDGEAGVGNVTDSDKRSQMRMGACGHKARLCSGTATVDELDAMVR